MALIAPIAVIDVGTNSVRFELYGRRDRCSPELLYRERYMPRLGTELALTGSIGSAGAARLAEVLEAVGSVLGRYSGALVGAVGTSALREAADGDAIVAEMERRFGIRILVISGEEEAALTARGIFANEPGLSGSVLLVDIGGGSTELSSAKDGAVLRSVSIPLGAIRAKASFLSLHSELRRPDATKLSELRAHCRQLLSDALPKDPSSEPPLIVGSSGTIRTLCTLEGRSLGHHLSYEAVSSLVNRMSTMTVEEIARIEGMERNRADIILPGAIIFQEIMRHVHATVVRATRFSLRHGVLARCAEEAARPQQEWIYLREYRRNA